MLKQISNHNAIYRGFDIKTLPRNAHQKKTLYWVMLRDESDGYYSFGKFDALAEAISYIDRLCGDQ